MSDHQDTDLARRRLLYGRRHGHKLRQGQQDLIDNLLPKLAVDLEKAGQAGGIFSSHRDDIWLEIGFGGGEHLAAVAAQNPNIGFIGCEPFVNGVAKLLAQVRAQGLANIRIHMGDARDLLDTIPMGSLGRAMLLFPDPWPKTRHHKRRFINQGTLAQLHRALRPGAEFRVATDIPDYCRWTMMHMHRFGGFDWLAESPSDWRVRPSDWPATRYENKALRQGRTPVYLRFRRNP